MLLYNVCCACDQASIITKCVIGISSDTCTLVRWHHSSSSKLVYNVVANIITMTSDDGNSGSAALLLRYATFLGATGVSAGAFGAHALKDKLTNKGHENWKTAVLYQLVHATVLVGMSAFHQSATSKNARNGTVLAGKLMTVGTVLFSGSIYLLSLNVGPKKLLGPTTPIGGLCMIAGWIVLGVNAS
jgi:uncharacterized membrane protein YgdD (TMEM256/DUF423 family)